MYDIKSLSLCSNSILRLPLALWGEKRICIDLMKICNIVHPADSENHRKTLAFGDDGRFGISKLLVVVFYRWQFR